MHQPAVTEIAEELEFERNILRELLKQAPTAVIVTWGRELRFRYVSDRSLEFMPYERDELIGRTVDEVFPNAAEAIEEVRVAILDRGETVEVHDVPLAASGPDAWEGDRYYTFISSPVEGPDGSPAGVLNVGYETTADVRARKLLERELATEQRIATQLQVSLMPDSLPDVPGHGPGLGLPPGGRRPRDRRRLLRRLPRRATTAGWWWWATSAARAPRPRPSRRWRGTPCARRPSATAPIRAPCTPGSTRRCCASARTCASCPRCARSWSRWRAAGPR